jgi:hypothetical protein
LKIAGRVAFFTVFSDYQPPPPKLQHISFAHAEPPVRPERHNPSSISSLRIGQARLLAARLPRSPWCGTDGRPAL